MPGHFLPYGEVASGDHARETRLRPTPPTGATAAASWAMAGSAKAKTRPSIIHIARPNFRHIPPFVQLCFTLLSTSVSLLH